MTQTGTDQESKQKLWKWLIFNMGKGEESENLQMTKDV